MCDDNADYFGLKCYKYNYIPHTNYNYNYKSNLRQRTLCEKGSKKWPGSQWIVSYLQFLIVMYQNFQILSKNSKYTPTFVSDAPVVQLEQIWQPKILTFEVKIHCLLMMMTLFTLMYQSSSSTSLLQSVSPSSSSLSWNLGSTSVHGKRSSTSPGSPKTQSPDQNVSFQFRRDFCTNYIELLKWNSKFHHTAVIQCCLIFPYCPDIDVYPPT